MNKIGIVIGLLLLGLIWINWINIIARNSSNVSKDFLSVIAISILGLAIIQIIILNICEKIDKEQSIRNTG